ncbi:MAG: aspartate kinase [Candidatus Adlerbacteria bacterium]
MSDIIVKKFGGSSLADVGQFEKVLRILEVDPRRMYIVASAPGKRKGMEGDHKVTDLLLALYGKYDRAKNTPKTVIVGMIRDRFLGIAQGLGLEVFEEGEFDILHTASDTFHDMDSIVALGEYWNGRILAKARHVPFVDAKDVVKLNKDGMLDMNATLQSRELLLNYKDGCVIPGFYGVMPNGTVKTFTRGGSDLSGTVVARVVGAAECQLWSDVSGMLMTDPRIVPHAKPIRFLTYAEAGEMAYGGANVLHPETTFPVEEVDIPIRLLNTNQPDDEGTHIVPDHLAPERVPGSIVGIAGRQPFAVIGVKKPSMNSEVGFIHRVSGAFVRHDVNIEHMPGGIRTLNIIASKEQLNGKLSAVISDIEWDCAPVEVLLHTDMALICIVGRGMSHTPGVALLPLQALASVGVSVRMIDQDSNELNIIIGVNVGDYETAVRAIYAAFVT